MQPHLFIRIILDITEEDCRNHAKLEKEIKKNQKDVEEVEAQIASSDEKTDELRNKWLPDLKKEIQKVSDRLKKNFNRISCEGVLVLDKPKPLPDGGEDYKNYGLIIKARFRKNTSLAEVFDCLRKIFTHTFY